MSEPSWYWHWNPRKWQLVVRWLSPSRKFLYWQVGPVVRMSYRPTTPGDTDETT